MSSSVAVLFFFFLMIRRPPRSTLFPTRRSSDLRPLSSVLCPPPPIQDSKLDVRCSMFDVPHGPPSRSTGGEGRGDVAYSPSSAFRPPSPPLRLARGEGQGEVSVPAVGSPVVSSPIVLWSLALCAFLYAPTRFLHEANPTWRLTSLLWTLEVIGLTLLLLQMFTEVGSQRPQGRSQRSEIRGQWRGLAFPVCFFLVAVPWPSGLETFMVQSLMRSNVATTVELLGLFGIPAVQHANVIEVGTGVVGIDEACSGIRSLQATLMISLFLGELYRLTVRRRVGLVVLGFVLAFV